MNHKTGTVTLNDVEILSILYESDVGLSSKEIAELRENEDEDLTNIQYFLLKLQRKEYIVKAIIGNKVGNNYKYSLTTSGRKIIESVKQGKINPRGSFRTPMSSIGSCEVCGKQNCNRTRNRINGEMKKLCRDCLINDKPMTPEEYIDGRQHSSLNEFSIFPVHKRAYFQPKEPRNESKATV